MGGGGGTLDRVWALATAGKTIEVMTAAAETINLLMAGDNPYTVRANYSVTVIHSGSTVVDCNDSGEALPPRSSPIIRLKNIKLRRPE
jgi:hypothetical protein